MFYLTMHSTLFIYIARSHFRFILDLWIILQDLTFTVIWHRTCGKVPLR